MENQEIIKFAVKFIENDTQVKQAAREQAFIIKASDSTGTEDRFITTKGRETANDWKRQFTAAGFTNISVSPWQFEGNLSFSDVDAAFFNEVSNRPKIGYDLTPTRQNPFHGTNVDLYSTDARYKTDHSWKTDNFLHKHLVSKMNSDESKIRAGWFEGELTDWVNKIAALEPSLANVLDEQYPYYNSTHILKHIIEEKIDASSFVPTEQEIDYFGIDMYPLFFYLQQDYLRTKVVPYKLMNEALDKVYDAAIKHKFHKQYNQPEMSEFQARRNQELVNKEDQAAGWLNLLLRSKVG